MQKTDKPILNVFSGQHLGKTPIWLMRQAGRYLPEYRALRAKAEDFLNLCLTPEWAAEITLQPIRRFGFDAAILFADILLIPYALGLDLEFREGEGPVLRTVESETFPERLVYDDRKLEPVYETIDRVKSALPQETALIGFCGAPWTVACYMIDGNSRNDFAEARSWVRNDPAALDRLMSILVDASETYLSKQIEAGAELLQIFDSWAGLLSPEDFNRYVVKPTTRLVARLKAKYPQVPIIGFPREAGMNYEIYLRDTGVDGLSIDQNLDLLRVQKHLKGNKVLQGNLDPKLLLKGGAAMLEAAGHILDALGPRHIFNLGHGVVPQTPVENVAELVAFVRAWKARPLT